MNFLKKNSTFAPAGETGNDRIRSFISGIVFVRVAHRVVGWIWTRVNEGALVWWHRCVGVGEHTAVCMAGVSRSTWVVRRRRDRTQRPIPTRKTSPLGRSSRSLRLSRRPYRSPAPRTPRQPVSYVHASAITSVCGWPEYLSI